MQFQVPQFIQTEDKVVGPLTLRQFAYVGVAGALCGLLYFILQPWLWVIITILLLGIAVAIGFIKIEGRPLQKIILAAFHFYWKPQTFVWQPEHHPVRAKQTAPVKQVRQTKGRLQAIAEGMALHKSWAAVQTGAPLEKKSSDKQFFEKKMSQRYQIFKRPTGDRAAARRVDYR